MLNRIQIETQTIPVWEGTFFPHIAEEIKVHSAKIGKSTVKWNSSNSLITVKTDSEIKELDFPRIEAKLRKLA